ncbi:MAG: peptidoglycan-binding protein, partial [Gammaproteobacteria bacterium]|nr:peptidoglycan-binding protein [Gammaproteobacteria bacterium]
MSKNPHEPTPALDCARLDGCSVGPSRVDGRRGAGAARPWRLRRLPALLLLGVVAVHADPLLAQGTVSRKTDAALLAAVDRNTIARVQAELSRRGYDAGPADGAMGRRTEAAIVRYQRDNGLYASGEITEELLQHLFGGARAAPPAGVRERNGNRDYRDNGGRSWGGNRRDQRRSVASAEQLTEQLRQLTDRVERRNAAAPWVIEDLRAIISGEYGGWSNGSQSGGAHNGGAQLGAPQWRRTVYDDFADGDFDRNPSWQVAFGNFQVEPGIGLRVRPAVTAPTSGSQGRVDQKEIGLLVLGAILGQATGRGPFGQQSAPAADDRAEIFLPTPVDAAFRLEIQLSAGRLAGPLAIGLYQGASRQQGYFLLTSPQVDGALQLVRAEPAGNQVLASGPAG